MLVIMLVIIMMMSVDDDDVDSYDDNDDDDNDDDYDQLKKFADLHVPNAVYATTSRMINDTSQINTVDGNDLELKHIDNAVIHTTTTTTTTNDTNYITTSSNALINNKEKRDNTNDNNTNKTFIFNQNTKRNVVIHLVHQVIRRVRFQRKNLKH